MIDWEQVKILRDEVGTSSFDEIVALFIEEVEDVITRLRADPNPETLGDDLHFLKGSAMNLGFDAFSDACQQGESATALGDSERVDLASIFSSYDTSKSQFMANLPTALAN